MYMQLCNKWVKYYKVFDGDIVQLKNKQTKKTPTHTVSLGEKYAYNDTLIHVIYLQK